MDVSFLTARRETQLYILERKHWSFVQENLPAEGLLVLILDLFY